MRSPARSRPGVRPPRAVKNTENTAASSAQTENQSAGRRGPRRRRSRPESAVRPRRAMASARCNEAQKRTTARSTDQASSWAATKGRDEGEGEDVVDGEGEGEFEGEGESGGDA